MPMKEAHSGAEFDREVKGNSVVVVDFFAEWCGPCKMVAPLLQQLSDQYPDVCFLKVDVDKLQDVSSSLGVRSMPTFHFYVNGSLQEEFSGADFNRLKSSVAKYSEFAKPNVASFSGSGRKLDSGPRSPETGVQQTAGGRSQLSPEIYDMLITFGYAKEKVDVIAARSGASSIEEALDWVANHEAELESPVSSSGNGSDSLSIEVPGEIEPVVKPQQDKEVDEAKRAEMEEHLREKMVQARLAREEIDKKEAIEKERKRIMQGKDIQSSREKWKEVERKRAAELRKKDKREERDAKRRIREKIAEAKRDRLSGGSSGSGESPQVDLGATGRAQQQPVRESVSVDSDECRVQLRLPNGAVTRDKFKNAMTLGELKDYVFARYPEISNGDISFVNAYPRKTYMSDEFTTSLLEVGMFPNGTLNVQLE